MTTDMQGPDGPAHRRRKDARPSEILAAALREFADRGYAGTTLAGIAARAGIARGTVYLYYGSKPDIFDALMRQKLTDPLADRAGMLDGFDGSSRALLETLLALLHADMADPDATTLLRVLIAEGHRFPDLVRLHHDRIVDHGLGLLRRIVDRGIARGEFAPDLGDVDLRVVIAPVIMAAVWRIVFEEVAPLDRDRLFRSHLRVVLDGLRGTAGG
ncbi:MAG: TetR/AcrR family transcriptional regulator [Pseudomonadota bacterium]